MAEYWYTRVWIIASLLVFIAVAEIGFTDQYDGWKMLLLTTIVIGFTHYLVGGYYQLKSFARTARAIRSYYWFVGLGALSTLVTLVFIYTGYIVEFALLTIGYFMLHGFYNEITLFERGTGQCANRWTIASITTGLLSMTLLAFTHPSSLFSPQLEYVTQDAYLNTVLRANIPFTDFIILVGAFGLLCAVLLQVVAVVKSSHRFNHLLYLFGLVIVSVGLVFIPQLSYIHFFAGLLLYHFIVWFIFYYRQFSQR